MFSFSKTSQTHNETTDRQKQTSRNHQHRHVKEDCDHVGYYAADWHWIGQCANAGTSRRGTGKSLLHVVMLRIFTVGQYCQYCFMYLLFELAGFPRSTARLSLFLALSLNILHLTPCVTWPVSASSLLVALHLRPITVWHCIRCPGQW